jgi:hypothetical protein
VDPNLIYSDPAAFTAQLRASVRDEMRAELAQAAGSVSQPLASLARAEAARNPKYKDAWTRYTPEIDLVMQRVPEAQRGRVDLWNEAARMVQGEHMEEIAEIRAREIIARSGDAGMLSTQAGIPGRQTPSSTLSPIAKLFADNHPSVKGYQDAGISPAQVIAHGKKMGHEEAAYAVMISARTPRRLQIA